MTVSDVISFILETSAPRNVQHVLKGDDSVLVTWDAPAFTCQLITNYKVRTEQHCVHQTEIIFCVSVEFL